MKQEALVKRLKSRRAESQGIDQKAKTTTTLKRQSMYGGGKGEKKSRIDEEMNGVKA